MDDVLRQLSAELAELSRVSEDVESDVGSWLSMAIDELDDQTRGQAIRRLQRLDALTQTLVDLSKLTEKLAEQAHGEVRQDVLIAAARLERVARMALPQKHATRAADHGLSGDLTLF